MSKWRDQKKRYTQYKARKEQLPAGYLEAVDAVERYALRSGPATGEAVVTMLEDLAGIFEQGAEDGASVREIIGADPVHFAEEFLQNYPANPWTQREQQRLAHTLTHARPAEA